MKIEQRAFSCVAVVTPGERVLGKWVAHCLTFDVLAQANDPESALELVIAATREACLDDLNEGRDPTERKAPEDDWKIFHAAMVDGVETTIDEARRQPRTVDGRLAVIVASFTFTCRRTMVEAQAPLGLFSKKTVQLRSNEFPTAACA